MKLRFFSGPGKTNVPTYESTLEHFGLSAAQMKDECCEEVLHLLAKKMNRWRNIQLGVEKGVVEGIENDRSTDDEGKRNKLLERWKQKFGHEATYERMVRSLLKSERTDLADVVCGELNEILALNIMTEPQQVRSYDSTLELHGLESAQMQEVCEDEVLKELAKKMTHWQVIQLGVDKSVVQSIDNDRSTDEEEKRNNLLERWKQILGVEATYERLVQCLLTSLRTDLADVVCEELNELSALKVLRRMRNGEDQENSDTDNNLQAPRASSPFSSVSHSAPPLPTKPTPAPYPPYPGPAPTTYEPTMSLGVPLSPPIYHQPQTTVPGNSSPNTRGDSSSANPQLESMVVTVFTSLLNEERNASSELRMRLRMHESQMDQLSTQKRDSEARLSDKETRVVRLNENLESMQSKLNKARKKRNKAKEVLVQKEGELMAKYVELEHLKQENSRLVGERVTQDEKLAKAQYEAGIAHQEKAELMSTLRRKDEELAEVREEVRRLKNDVNKDQQQLTLYCTILYMTVTLLVFLTSFILTHMYT